MLVSLHTFFLVLLALLRPAFAGEDPFRVEALNASIAEGGSGKVTVIVRVPDGFHVYRDMMAVEVVNNGGLTIGSASFPPGEMAPDPASPGSLRELYEADVFVELPVTVPKGVQGTRSTLVNVRYQGCKKTLCYMPGQQDVEATVTVGGNRPGLPGGGPGDEAAKETPVTFAGRTEAGKLVVAADLQGDWHINRALFSVTPVEPGGWTFGEAVVPPGEKTGSEADGTAREDMTHDFDTVLPYSGSGPEELTVDVFYQACKGATLCLMPTTEQIKVKMAPARAEAAAPAPAPAAPAVAPAAAPAEAPPAVATTDSAFTQAASQGIGALLLLCFLAGVGVSFTPCVLPIVPITMGIIGARSAGSRIQAISLAATYVLGQAVVYTSLAVVVAQTGGLFGSWLQSPVLTFGIAGFFVIMGFSMFGFFDVQMPESIVNRLQGGDARSGYVGAAVLGVIGALVAGPCSGPIVASLLVYIGVQGNVWTGMALMFTFSLGMGMIFLVTGAMTGWMPSRGPWMATVKKGMGIFLWLMAVNFASPHLSTNVVALATAAVLLTTGVFSWPNPDDGEDMFTVRLRQLYAIVGVTVGLWLLLASMATQGFILPALKLTGAPVGETATVAGIPWLSDHDSALAQAKAANKPLLIDFTAEWCKACKELEHFTYTDAQVIAAAKDFVPVMIDCTEAGDPEVTKIQAKYGVNGLPTVLVVMPDGSISEKLIGFEPAPEFLARLRRVVPAGAGG